jgi:hypothetical protein
MSHTARGGQLDTALSITDTIDRMAPSVKPRRRGLHLGEVVVSLAETMLAGGDFLGDLDHQRKDAAGLARSNAAAWLPARFTLSRMPPRPDPASPH